MSKKINQQNVIVNNISDLQLENKPLYQENNRQCAGAAADSEMREDSRPLSVMILTCPTDQLLSNPSQDYSKLHYLNYKINYARLR